MAVLGAVMAVAGGGMKIAGDMRQAKQNEQMAEFNANVAQQNMVTVQQQAQENARRSLVQSNKRIGSQAAGYAASGVSGGSALDVMQDTAAKGEMDAITIRNQGDIKANSYANEYKLDRYRASNAITAGNWAAAGDTVGSGSKIAGMGSGGESA